MDLRLREGMLAIFLGQYDVNVLLLIDLDGVLLIHVDNPRYFEVVAR